MISSISSSVGSVGPLLMLHLRPGQRRPGFTKDFHAACRFERYLFVAKVNAAVGVAGITRRSE
jgi:hypothetical protein